MLEEDGCDGGLESVGRGSGERIRMGLEKESKKVGEIDNGLGRTGVSGGRI